MNGVKQLTSKEVGGTYATGYSVRNAVQCNTHVAKIRTSSGNEIFPVTTVTIFGTIAELY